MALAMCHTCGIVLAWLRHHVHLGNRDEDITRLSVVALLSLPTNIVISDYIKGLRGKGYCNPGPCCWPICAGHSVQSISPRSCFTAS